MDLRSCIILLCLLAVGHSRSYKRQSDIAKADLEAYIASKRPELNYRYRPHYHIAPPVGWLNDPNGFSFYKGEYHMFYQFYPYDSVWGPMHWGHSVSTNLVDWTTLPTALLPEEEMCFSGSAVVDRDTMILMYTGHIVTETEPFFNQTQYIAHSDDGIDFYKYEGNPVLPSAPNGNPDFRDPKVWKHGDHWYAVIGSKTNDDRGNVLLYRSPDMINWEFLSVLAESEGDLGYMWECPDFFEIGDKFVLLLSPQGMEPIGDRYKNVHQNGYIVGKFNYDTFEFEQETEFREIDFGHDFYASQTTENDGKRYVVAWFSMWDKYYPEAVDGWVGILTIVRELELAGDRLLMKPVQEITSLREHLVFTGKLRPEQFIMFEQTGEVLINGDLNSRIELLLEGRNGGDSVSIIWDPVVGKVIVDKGGDIRQVEWSPISSHSWRLFLDASSLELFCGEGEVVFSTRAYPDGQWNLTNLSPQELIIEAYHLRRSVPE